MNEILLGKVLSKNEKKKHRETLIQDNPMLVLYRDTEKETNLS